MTNEVSIKKLILVPALITLAVTLLRLTGELMHWSKALFNPAAGGGGAIVGIAWLVPVFGIYFGLKVAGAGLAPAAMGPAIGYSVLGFAVMPALGFTAVKLGLPAQGFGAFALFIVLAIVGGVIAYRAWPALGRVLLAYGLAARIPVAIVMLVAILGNWGTHYDVAPPKLAGDEPHRQVAADRPAAPAHHLDLVHDRGGDDLRRGRRGRDRTRPAPGDGLSL